MPITQMGVAEPEGEEGGGDKEIAIYSKDRVVHFFLSRKAPGTAYKLLDKAVRHSVAGGAGLKQYMNARLERRGAGAHEALVIDVGKPLPAQAW